MILKMGTDRLVGRSLVGTRSYTLIHLHRTIWNVWAYSHVDIDGQQGPSKYTRYHDAMAVWNRWTGLMEWNAGMA